jgi:hypothetical protein
MFHTHPGHTAGMVAGNAPGAAIDDPFLVFFNGHKLPLSNKATLILKKSGHKAVGLMSHEGEGVRDE